VSADVDALPDMLARLKLTALRDRLDGLLDEAARGDLSLRETLALLRYYVAAATGEIGLVLGA